MSTMKEIIEICEKYNHGEIKEDTFIDFLTSLNPVSRLNLYNKGLIIDLALGDLDDMETIKGYEFENAINMEVIYVLRFLMSYIEVEKDIYSFDDSAVDTLYNAGVVDYILTYCNKDFEILKRMFDNAIKFKVLNSVRGAIDSMVEPANVENITRIEDIFKDKETIDKVVNIMMHNDPSLHAIKEEIFAPLQKELKV